jgi:tetratricopeptide (TPR) repeat protein
LLTNLAVKKDACLIHQDFVLFSFPMGFSIDNNQLTQLREILTDHFNKGELRELCVDLGVDYESLPGGGKANKARELVDYLKRHERLAELIEIGRRQRPSLHWPEPSGVVVERLLEVARLSITHNLPPRSDFVGREDEKKRVHEALRSRSYLVSIDGIGGIGKSSLALEVAHECLQASQPEASESDYLTFASLIWVTAKDRELPLNGLLDTIAHTLGYPGVVRQHVEEKFLAVRKLLQAKRCLLIVDNFETVTDEGVRDFLLDLPEPSKGLITTREQKLSGAWAISLKGLTEQEALILIRGEGKRLGLASVERADDMTLRHLYKATGGAPLAMKWSVGQIKQKGQSLDSVLNVLHEARGSIFDNVFARSWSLLSDEARQLLMIMPVFATSASQGGIEAASDLHHFALDEALGQLVEMSLVEATDELQQSQRRYAIHPLTRAFAANKLQEIGGVEQAARQRLAQFLQDYTKEHGGYWRQKGFGRLEPELPNILEVLKWSLEENLPQLSISIYDKIAYFLVNAGYWKDVLNLGEQVIEQAIASGNEREAARIRDWPIGWVYRHQGHLDLADKQVKLALGTFEKYGDERGIAAIKRSLARILQERGEFDQAEQLLREALAFQEAVGDKRQIYFVTANLARAMRDKDDLDGAWELCQKTLPAVREFDDPERLSHFLGILAYIAQKRGDLVQVKAFLEEALTHSQRANRLDATANNLYGLGGLYMREGDEQTAYKLLSQALDFYRRLDMKPQVQQLERRLASLSKVKLP